MQANDAARLATLSAGAIAALHHGNRIEAIRIVRAEHELDLKGAKDVVDAYVRSRPTLQASLKQKNSAAMRTLALRLCAAVIVIAVGALLVARR